MGPMHYRWHLSADPNFDGVLSISDVWLWIKWFYFAPGDLIILSLASIEPLGTFFELGPHSYGNWFSAVVGAPFMLLACITISVIIYGIFDGVSPSANP